MAAEGAASLTVEAAIAGRRNLVVSCDGTNNTLTGGVGDTNVLLLYGYLRNHAPQRQRSTTTPASARPIQRRRPV